MAFLDSHDTAGNHLRYILPAEEGAPIVLGSAEDATLRYDSEGVAAHHAVITPAAGQFSIAPLEGEVRVNEALITEAMLLVPGVDYALGSLHLSFSAEELPAEEAEAGAEEPETAEAEEATADTTAPRTKTVRRKKSRSAAAALAAASAMPSASENPLVTLITPFYVIAVLAAAFVAGLTLRYWMVTGGFLPSAWLGE